MIVDFKIALATEAIEHGIVLAWLNKPSSLNREPDGFFRLTLPDGRHTHCFLEADTGTEKRDREYLPKLQDYRSWIERGGATAEGIGRPRILTVTKTEGRLKSLSAAAPAHPAFWFTSASRYRQASLLAPIWELPERPGELLPLVPATTPAGG